MALNRRQLSLVAVALTVIVVVAGGVYWKWYRPNHNAQPASDEIAVQTQTARITTLKEIVSAAGTVVPQTAADLVISATEACAIAELPKQEGETVQAGDIVVRLDIPAIAAELATRQLEVSDATTKVETTKAESTRLTSLYERGLAARTQADTARNAYTAAEAALGQARSRLETAKLADAGTVIRARFAGIVIKRWHNAGDMVSGLESDPILRIVDPARLQISAPLPPEEAVRVLPGQFADIQSESGPMSAVVALKLGSQSATVTTTDVRLNFTAPTALPIDTPLQVTIVVNERRDVLVVPAEAIQRADNQTFVWVANTNNQATRREVRIGYITNGQAEVVAGLTAGELVITAGISELTEGVRIVIGR